ncbi:hypothetical protein [Bifidobacterium myosotis]|uniref:Leucine rich repeat variant n=1 Tax=Bifidobacterium myosotis TaxID=1630166 RepID=A0A5M9ZHN4_9BIFI|nr:hypothetical protein [Bifidobacterium myosotis]KAA8825108.1 hypothetical protein EMO91_12835 [Bifidobacterium myosotis]
MDTNDNNKAKATFASLPPLTPAGWRVMTVTLADGGPHRVDPPLDRRLEAAGMIAAEGWRWRATDRGLDAVRALTAMAGDPEAHIPVAVRRVLARTAPAALVNDPDRETRTTAAVHLPADDPARLRRLAQSPDPEIRATAANRLPEELFDAAFDGETDPTVLIRLVRRSPAWAARNLERLIGYTDGEPVLAALLASTPGLDAHAVHQLAAHRIAPGSLWLAHDPDGDDDAPLTDDDATALLRDANAGLARLALERNPGRVTHAVAAHWCATAADGVIAVLLSHDARHGAGLVDRTMVATLVGRADPDIDLRLARHIDLLDDAQIDAILERADGGTADTLYMAAGRRRWTDHELALLDAKCGPNSRFRDDLATAAHLLARLGYDGEHDGPLALIRPLLAD